MLTNEEACNGMRGSVKRRGNTWGYVIDVARIRPRASAGSATAVAIRT
jgi:hypothetical protein